MSPHAGLLPGIISSQFSTHVGFVPFPSWPSDACMALQRGGMWWKQCLLFSRFPQQVSTANHMFSVTHGLQHQYVSHRTNCFTAISQELDPRRVSIASPKWGTWARKNLLSSCFLGCHGYTHITRHWSPQLLIFKLNLIWTAGQQGWKIWVKEKNVWHGQERKELNSNSLFQGQLSVWMSSTKVHLQRDKMFLSRW